MERPVERGRVKSRNEDGFTVVKRTTERENPMVRLLRVKRR